MTEESSFEQNRVVSPTEWLEARKALLAWEKSFSRQQDQLAKARRELPWVKVEKEYVFQGPDGDETLSELFRDKSQLIVYHFMFGPDWDDGCPFCSFLTDHFNPAVIHLAHRDVTMLAISRGPQEKLEAFKQKMGWTFKWVTCGPSCEFNVDFGVEFDPIDVENSNLYYNYREGQSWGCPDAPGVSVFIKNPTTGDIFHTYSTYARGLDNLIGTYHYLDLCPRGRDEEGLQPFKMAWVKRSVEYDIIEEPEKPECEEGGE